MVFFYKIGRWTILEMPIMTPEVKEENISHENGQIGG